jgi:hypothetical protein
MKAIVLGILRHVLTAVGGAGLFQGALSNDDWNTATSAILTLAGIAWSVYEKRKVVRA